MNSRLILVGGFLGAGKTTLLAEAAKRLAASGIRVGLITNDQAPELVDTAFLSRSAAVSEVSGSCFCCNFPGLLDAMSKLRSEARADVLIAEPVGSCTDLSATIVQPLKDLHAGEVTVAPLTVLADPGRLADISNGGNGGLHPSAAYIFRKQLEEADVVLITKSDLLDAASLEKLVARTAREYPLARVSAVSAESGEGVDFWLAQVMAPSGAGLRLAEIDYDVYAEGEAVLGWLNATFELTGTSVDWKDFAFRLLSELSARIDTERASVGHVKVLIEGIRAGVEREDRVVGNLTGPRKTLRVRGAESRGDAALLTLNAQVEMSPGRLESITREAIEAAAKRIQVAQIGWRCLIPGRPTPTFRYDRLVSIA
ncbi:MAG TPA: GTP-binding protein [Fimbriimonadaceae bacterium]|nr:GTP-binding protein [Fimbriimonadaceae bacterium]